MIHPSKSAQKIIKTGQIAKTPLRLDTVEPVKWQKDAIHLEEGDADSSDSDTTIIYTPPPMTKPAKKGKKRSAAKFVIRTIGLKAHNDAVMIKEAKKYRKRVFKCYLCLERFSSTKRLNHHFKVWHNGLDCEVCGWEFNSPLSQKKHSYVHGSCPHVCGFCGKRFPFKSERDIHENSHTKTLRFAC